MTTRRSVLLLPLLSLEQFLQPRHFTPLSVQHLEVKRDPGQRAVELMTGRHPEPVDGGAGETYWLRLFRTSGTRRPGLLVTGSVWTIFDRDRHIRNRHMRDRFLAVACLLPRFFGDMCLFDMRILRWMTDRNHQLPHDLGRHLDHCPAGRAKEVLASAHDNLRLTLWRELAALFGLCDGR